MRLRSILLLIFLTMSSVSTVAHAQSAPARHVRPSSSHFLWQRPVSHSADTREPLGGLLGRGDLDYRYTGFFVGAGLGVVLTAFAFALCGEGDDGCDGGRVLPAGVLMSAIMGLGGAVIGGFLPKESSIESSGAR